MAERRGKKFINLPAHLKLPGKLHSQPGKSGMLPYNPITQIRM